MTQPRTIKMPELSEEQRAYLDSLKRPAPDMNRVIGPRRVKQKGAHVK